MATTLPQTIYVTVEQDLDEDYFNSDINITELVVMGEKREVGIYKLVSVHVYEGVASRVGESKEPQ